jgi:hypothetical protein
VIARPLAMMMKMISARLKTAEADLIAVLVNAAVDAALI